MITLKYFYVNVYIKLTAHGVNGAWRLHAVKRVEEESK